MCCIFVMRTQKQECFYSIVQKKALAEPILKLSDCVGIEEETNEMFLRKKRF